MNETGQQKNYSGQILFCMNKKKDQNKFEALLRTETHFTLLTSIITM